MFIILLIFSIRRRQSAFEVHVIKKYEKDISNIEQQIIPINVCKGNYNKRYMDLAYQKQ